MECLINKFNSFQLRKANTDCGSKLHIVLGNLHDSTYDKQKTQITTETTILKHLNTAEGFHCFLSISHVSETQVLCEFKRKCLHHRLRKMNKNLGYLEVKYHEITEKKKNMEYLSFSNFFKKLSAV